MRNPRQWWSQALSVTRFSILTIPERKGACAASALGIAGVVGVLVGTLSIAQGFRHAMTAAGYPDTAIVMRSGADSEMMSFLGVETTHIVADAPGVAYDAHGPLASAELFVIINLPMRASGTDANVPVRGLSPAGLKVRRDVRLVAGRWFVPGRNEVVVGQAAAAMFRGLDLGDWLHLGKTRWRVVGQFRAGGGLGESEIWTDAPGLQSAYQRGNSFQSVLVRLTSPAAFTPFKAALMRDPRLNVKVVRQTQFYAEQSRTVYNLITGLGSIIAGLMGLGAVFGALNTMYSAVATRTREIATLRALGFGAGPVVASVLLESLLLALAGGALGAGLAYFVFNGYQAATMNWQSFSQVAFAFAVTPALLGQGILYALIIGLIGGLFPGLRAARLPVATALRES